MSVRGHGRLVLVAAAATVLAASAAVAAWRWWPRAVRRESGLNVLLVTVDTLRADSVGAFGQARATTPRIDRLARGGVRFTTARAHSTVTLPSHANILSGHLPPDHGVRDNSGFRFPARLDTLATLLHGRGYRTGAFVSSLTLDSRFGLDRGFDVYDDAFERRASRGLDLPERSGTATIARARAWIASAGKGPWLCWVHLYDPHAPYAPPSPWRESFGDSPYLGEVAATDAALAPLLDPILDEGPAGRTLVVFTSDHGESLGEHGERTHGLFAYEATLRVPLVLHAPRLLRPRSVDSPVRHVDLLPTVLDALGLPAPDGLAGRSLLPVANGHRAEPAASYFEALSSSLSRHWAPLHGVVGGGFKYVDLPLPELYDLRRDPREERNRVEEETARVGALRRQLARLRGGEHEVAPQEEDLELRQRLAALGYLAAAGPRKKAEYGPQDDPKRLVHLDGLMQQAVDLRRSGDLAGAHALASRVVKERPDMTGALLQLALIEREMGDLARALETLGQAAASSPDDPNPAVLLAGLLGESGQPERGLPVLAPWLERATPSTDVLTTRGILLARLNRPAEALASFQRAREQDPSSAMILVQMATVHLAAGDRTRARAALEEALRRDGDLALAHDQLGVLALAEGDAEQAETRFRAALDRDPDQADALLNLGRLLLARKRAEEARPALERFVAVAPRDVYGREVDAVRAWLGGRSGPARLPAPAAF